MSPSLRRLLPAAAALAVALVSSCVDGGSPTALDVGGTATLAVVPRYAPGPLPAEGDAPVNRIRVTARLQADNTVLATLLLDVDPNATEWDLRLDIPVPPGGGSVILTIELVHVDPVGGTEEVQWSGVSPPMPLTPGQPQVVQEVQVVRGPTENLAVTGVTITPDSARVVEGDSVRLTANVQATSPTATPRIFWTSLDTLVARVDESGRVRALLPGTARIVAQSGRPADTARVVVIAIPVAVRVSPRETLLESAGAEAAFTAEVLDARGAPIAGEQVGWTSLDPALLESLGGGRFLARAAGSARVEARSVSDPALADTALVSLDFPEADLSVTKTAGAAQVSVGDTTSFVVTVTNHGPDAAGAFVVEDFVPSGLTYVDGSATAGTVSTAPLRLAVPGLEVGASVTWRLDFRVDRADEPLVSNAAEVVSAATHDPDPADNRAVAQIAIATQADVSVELTLGRAVAVPGDTVAIRTRVANAGPARARDVRVALPLPDGLTLLDTDAGGGVFDAVTGVWTLPALDAGASAELGRRALVDADAPEELTLMAGYDAPASDPSPANDTARATLRVSPNTVDLGVAKRFDRASVREQDTLRWRVEVVNRGPATARDLRLADSLDVAGFESVRLLGAEGIRSTNPGAGRDLLEIDSLAPGDTARIDFEGVVRAGTAGRTLWNRVRVEGLSPLLERILTTDDADSASVAVVSNVADLRVAKRASRDTIHPGDTVRYRVAVRNAGPATARRIEVIDTFDVTRFRSVTVVSRTQGMEGSLPGRLRTDSLVAGDSAVIEIAAVVDSAVVGVSVRNRAGVTRLEGARDTVQANDTITVDVFVAPRIADLAVIKRVNRDTASVGDTLTFDVRVVNRGPSRILGFELAEAMDPSLLTGVRIFESRGIVGSIPGTLSGSPLAAGDTARLVFTAVVTPAADQGEVRNRARVVSVSGASDTEPGNDADSVRVVIKPRRTDVTVAKTVSADSAMVGDSLVYEVQVVNVGPATLDSVVLVDRLDTWAVGTPVVLHTDFVRGASGTHGDTLVSGPMQPGDTARLRVKVVVQAVAAGDTVRNRIALESVYGGVDMDASNDSATVHTSITPEANLAVTKWVDDAVPFEGDTVTYTVEVANWGSHTARNVVLFDSLDAGLTQVSALATRGAFNLGDRSWTLDSLGAGQVDTLTLEVRVDSGTVAQTLWNRAGVTGYSGAVELDATDDTASVSLEVFQREADLAVTKWVDDAAPFEGDTVTYTVEVANWGSHTARNVVLFDSLDAGLTQVSALATRGAFNPANGSWTLDSLGVGQVDTLTLEVRVDSGTVAQTLWNRAGVTGYSGAVELDATDDTASVSLEVDQREADLAVTKWVDNSVPFEGDTVTYTVEVANWGSHPARNVVLFDSLDAGLTQLAHALTRGSFNLGDRTWTLDSLGVGQVDTLTLEVRVDSGTVAQTLWNRAGVAGYSGAVELDATDDTASVSLEVFQREANLAVTKWVDDAAPFEGDTVTYTVEVANWGSHTARNVVLFDSLDAGLTQLAHALTRGAFNLGDRSWTLDSLGVGQVDTLTLEVKVDSGTVAQTLWNRAGVAGYSGAVELDATDDTASVSLEVDQREADLAVTKWVDNSVPFEGDTVTYTVEVANWGSHTARNVVLFDSLDAGLTQLAHALTRGSFNLGDRTWTLDSLAAGQVDTLTLEVKVDSGTVAQTLWNRAGVAGYSGAVELDATDDTASVSLEVDQREADLAVLKWVDNSVPFEGDTVTYTVEVANWGSHTARNVVLFDSLDAGLTQYQHVFTAGSFDVGTRRWTLDSIPAGRTDSLTLRIIVAEGTAGDTLRNRAGIVSYVGAVETDASDDTASVSVEVFQRQADLEVTKSANRGTAQVGDTITWTLSLTNHGPHTTRNVFVSDTLPSAVAITSTVASRGSYASNTWVLDTLHAGATETLTLKSVVQSGTPLGPIVNRAWLEDAGPVLETDASNDADSASVAIQGVDLVVTSASTNASPAENQTFSYTVGVRNVGNLTATGVAILDSIPSGMIFQSASVTLGAYSANTWSVGTLAPGDSARLTLTVRPANGTATTTITNRARVSAVSPVDVDASSDTTEHPLTIAAPDLLALTKTSTNASPAENQTFNYVVRVRNVGPVTLTSVTVRDTIPVGMILGAPSASHGSWVGSTWSVGTLNPGDSATLTLPVRPANGTATTTITNRAWASAAQTDTVASNNVAELPLTIAAPDLLALTKTSTVASPAENQTFNYVVRVKNVGPVTLTAVTVRDSIPVGMILGSPSASQGSWVGPTWSVGTLAPGDSATLTLPVRPANGTATTTITNRAWASAAQTDTVASNNVGVLPLTIAAPDLIALTKTSTVASPAENQSFNYVVRVRNVGPVTVTGITVSDTIPVGITLQSVGATQGTWVGPTWSVGNLNPGDSATLTLTVKPAAGTAGTPRTNRAWASAAQTDTVASNNMASATVNVPSPELEVAASVSSSDPSEGEDFQYKVVVRNPGLVALTNVMVRDTIPDGIDYITQAHVTQSTYNSSTGTWGPLSLNPGDSAVMILDVEPAPGSLGSVVLNRIHATASEVPTPVRDSVSHTVGGDDLLRTVKTSSTAEPREGETFEYRIVVRNVGPGQVEDVVVHDTLPSGIEFVSQIHTTHGAYSPQSSTWGTFDLTNPGDSAVLVLGVRPHSGTVGQSLVNRAHAAGLQTDTVRSTDANIATILVSQDTVDLVVAKVADDTLLIADDSVRFTVTVQNAGPDTARSVEVVDSLSAWLTFLAASPSQGSLGGGGNVRTWNVGTLAPGATATLTLDALAPVVDTLGNAWNVARLTSIGAGPVLINPADDTARVTLTVRPDTIDLQVTKVVDDADILVDDTATFTVTVRNVGPGTARSVQLVDSISTWLTYLNASPSQGNMAGAGNVPYWNVGDLAPGDSATLTLQTVAPTSDTLGNVWNRVGVSSVDTDNLLINTYDDTASVTLTVRPDTIDLQVTKLVDDADILVDDTATFTVTVRNVGPGTARSVQLVDSISTWLTYLNASPSQGNMAGAGNVPYWNVGDLAPGDSATLTLRALAPTSDTLGNVWNRVGVSSVDTDNLLINTYDDTASVTIDVRPYIVDLRLSKTFFGEGWINVGDTITYVLAVTNWGPDPAPSVQVRDTVPDGLTFLDATPDPGYGSFSNDVWTIPQVPESTTVELALRMIVEAEAAGSTVTNTAWIESNAKVSDWSTANDTSSVEKDVLWTDLAVTVALNKQSVVEGDSVVFTAYVENPGGDQFADTAHLEIMIPAGFTYLDHETGGGSFDPQTGLWALGEVGDPGRTLYVRALAEGGSAGQVQTFRAEVTGSSPWDIDADNDTASVSITPNATNASLSLIVRNQQQYAVPLQADSLVYQLELENWGPGVLTNVVIHDTVPDSLSFTQWVAPQGTSFQVVGGVGIWTIDTVQAYDQLTLEILAEYDGFPNQFLLENRARLISMDQTDSIAADDTTSWEVLFDFGSQQQDGPDLAALDPLEASSRAPARDAPTPALPEPRTGSEADPFRGSYTADAHPPSPITTWSRTGIPRARPASPS